MSAERSPVPWTRIVPLAEVEASLVASFSCGNEEIDNWLHEKASTWCRIGRCAVHVAIDSVGCPVGFFSLSSRGLFSKDVGKKHRYGKSKLEFSTWLIGYLGIREDLQRTPEKCGTALLDHAVKKALELSNEAGGSFVTVDPIDSGVERWYIEYGFLKSAQPDSVTLYLPMKVAAERVESLGNSYYVF